MLLSAKPVPVCRQVTVVTIWILGYASGFNVKLDRYDIAILGTLMRHGRISKRDLAEQVGLSVSPCWVRMRKLEDAGFINGYTALIDVDQVARFCHITTLVKLRAHRAIDFRRFEQVVCSIPEVIGCEAVIGSTDYILQWLTSDIDSYQDLFEDLLEKDIGIQEYYSHVRSKLVRKDVSAAIERLLVAAN